MHFLSCPGRKDVTLRKLDIKVETVNREPLTLHTDREEDTASVSTATRVMKAIYSVRGLPTQLLHPKNLRGDLLFLLSPNSRLGQKACESSLRPLEMMAQIEETVGVFVVGNVSRVVDQSWEKHPSGREINGANSHGEPGRLLA